MKNKNKRIFEFIPINTLLLITLLELLSHQVHIPLWLSIFVIMVCILKFLYYRSNQNVTPFFIRFFLVLISTIIFILYYQGNFSVDMAASFLFLAAVLKLVEINNKKDIHVFIFTMLYLSAISFLFEQGILQVIHQIIIIVCCFYALFIIQFEELDIKHMHFKLLRLHTKSMFTLIAVAIPVVVVLFLFFPRIAPLWQMPLKNQVSKVGIGTELSPGDISKLAKTAESAFRVTFTEITPNRSSLYWKGLILDHFDGRKWTQSSSQGAWERLSKVDAGHFYKTTYPAYQVMLEPHQQKWVFSLDGSEIASSNLLKSEMGLFQLKTEAIQATRYQMEMPTNIETTKLLNIPTAFSIHQVDRVNNYKQQDLQLPPSRINPKTQHYIQQLRLKFPNNQNLLIYLLTQFREEAFYYTLEPPLLGENFVDEFLFDSKSGFCGHYASSLTYMLRLAAIPARVVIGYHGGEYNSQSNYLLVSQYDAHAWVEAYLPNLGWVRLDPTEMVSPLRISDGPSSSLENDNSFLENSPFASAAMKYSTLNWIRLRLDEINFKWQNVVVNYNQDQQKSFVVKALGEFSLLKIALVFIYFFVGFFMLMHSYLWLKRLSGYSSVEKKYMIWLFILSKFGLTRHSGETPRMFLQRLQKTKHKKIASITAKRTQVLEDKQYRES